MELANTLFRYRGTEVAGTRRVGRGDPPAAADAGAGRAAHHRGAVEPPRRRGRRAVGRRSTPSPGPRSMPPRSSSRPARSRSRSTASCATGSIVAADATAERDRGGRAGEREDRRPSSPAGRRIGSSSPAAGGWSTSSSGDRAVRGRRRVRSVPRGIDARGRRRSRGRSVRPSSTALPGAVEWFDPGNGLLAIGTAAVDARPAVRDHPAPRPTSTSSWSTASTCRTRTVGSRGRASGPGTSRSAPSTTRRRPGRGPRSRRRSPTGPLAPG